METALLDKPASSLVDFQNIYQRVTDVIIEQLEVGTIPWQQPWIGDHRTLLGLPFNYTTGNYYQGINIVLLWCSAIKNKYNSDEWGGFQQWKDKDEAVRKDEKGSLVVYYNTIEKEVDGKIEKIPFLKSLKVFNRCQLASYNQKLSFNEQEVIPSLVEKISIVDEFVANPKAIIEQHDGGACYIPSSDKIMLPHSEKFQGSANCTATEGFYSVLFHELTHWSGAKHRLNREWGKKFGDKDYSAEELVAELGAAFLTKGFGLATLEKGDHAGYIDHWLKVLKENNRFIVTAAGEAAKAVDYLQHLQQI